MSCNNDGDLRINNVTNLLEIYYNNDWLALPKNNPDRHDCMNEKPNSIGLNYFKCSCGNEFVIEKERECEDILKEVQVEKKLTKKKKQFKDKLKK